MRSNDGAAGTLIASGENGVAGIASNAGSNWLNDGTVGIRPVFNRGGNAAIYACSSTGFASTGAANHDAYAAAAVAFSDDATAARFPA
ncbi:hypothetical protein M3G47_05745 [Corynebacterium sanguinis]|uniref:hypothetical protein n=1 Tax=Corynebacterium sanguinis TaxID=2594913 RepID=UPI0021A4C748|nr:hypothetical protein [Corynebacterium sanguinis]MCT2247592.1 hypothetical protein [Corynebacterium sanguinis]